MEYMRALKDLRSRMASLSQGVDETPKNSYVQARQPVQTDQKSTEDIIAQSKDWLAEMRAISEKSRKLNLQPSNESGFAKGFRESYGTRPKKRPEPVETQEEKDAKVAPLVARRGERPSNYAPDSGETTPVPADAKVSKVLDAVAAVESAGSGDYKALGPVVTKGMYKGQRAYGRYQVMEGNIGPWTEAALGRRLTKDEFLADPKAQDAVAAHQLQMSKDKHGTWEDAVSVWFSGRPMAQAGNADDGYLSTPQYINKFRRNFVRV